MPLDAAHIMGFLQVSTEAFWEWDLSSAQLIDHQRCQQLLGASEQQNWAHSVQIRCDSGAKEPPSTLHDWIAQFVASAETQASAEIKLLCSDQRWHWMQIHAMRYRPAPAANTLPPPERVLGSLRDIHAQKLATQTQAALFAISEAAQTCLQLDALYGQIHHIIAQLLPAENFYIALHDAASDMVSFAYYVDQHDVRPAPRKLGAQGLTQRVIRNGEAVLMTPEMRAERVKKGEQIVGTICMDWLGVPLVNADNVIGALVIQSYSGEVRYSRSDKELLRFVSHQVASAIVRKRDLDRLAELALQDTLTGLANRALWQERLQRAILEAEREAQQFVVLYCDLNKFKPINDQYGHDIGDQLLIACAERLRGCLRESDTVARLGGDEFTILLRQLKSETDAHSMRAKIAAVIAQPFVISGHALAITVSIGAALYPRDGQRFETLMQHADQALCALKRER
jgi:diguanylate cyclase (GGDEF)-like protein